eukprot:m.114590 g.114590  ORF g.114590 m.114590 type:complete len:78 (-) comp13543_c0_seq5:803-1036(-)
MPVTGTLKHRPKLSLYRFQVIHVLCNETNAVQAHEVGATKVLRILVLKRRGERQQVCMQAQPQAQPIEPAEAIPLHL